MTSRMRVATYLLTAATLAATSALARTAPKIYAVRVWPRERPISLRTPTFAPIAPEALRLASAFYAREGGLVQAFEDRSVVLDFRCYPRPGDPPFDFSKLIGPLYDAFRPSFDRPVLVVFPPCPALPFAGWAEQRGKIAWAAIRDGDTPSKFAATIAHELGHLYGLNHALGPNPYSVVGAATSIGPTTTLSVVERAILTPAFAAPFASGATASADARFALPNGDVLWIEFPRSEPSVARVYATRARVAENELVASLAPGDAAKVANYTISNACGVALVRNI